MADLDWVKGIPFGPEAVTAPQTVLEGLMRTPMGQRGVLVNGALRLPGLPKVSAGFFDSNASVVLPWANEYERRMTPVLSSWFAKFRALGGKLDVVVMDWESQDLVTLPAIAQQRPDNTSSCGCHNAAALIEGDVRWPSLQATLNARGRLFDVSFPSLKGWELWAEQSHSTDKVVARTAQYRTLVWNDVMIQQTAAILNRTVFEPARGQFPSVLSSNYAHFHLTSDWRLWTWPGGLPGGGAHVGTAQSKSFYNTGGRCGTPPHLAHWTGCYVTQEVTPYSEVNITRSRFQTLLTSIRTVRGMVVARVELIPWVAPRDFDGCNAFDGCEFHGSALYQEQLMHMALSGVRHFLWWRWSRLPTMTGTTLFTEVLEELDELLTDESRLPLALLESITPQDPWLLSGMLLPRSNQEIWRLTLRDNATTLIASNPATFRVPSLGLPAVVPVPHATVLGRGNVSVAGWWLVRAGSAASRMDSIAGAR